jgi:hypothetical protein
MRAMSESHLTRVAIELNLIGVRKCRRIAIGERGRHGDFVARHDLHTGNLHGLDAGSKCRDCRIRPQ